MTNPKNLINTLFPFEIEEGKRIINEYGVIETIYRIEYGYFGKYFSTIATDDVNFLMLKTYFIEKNGEEITIKKIVENKKNILRNLEKATLDYIENNLGLNALASQLN